jgi:hypothetical protein
MQLMQLFKKLTQPKNKKKTKYVATFDQEMNPVTSVTSHHSIVTILSISVNNSVVECWW